jgi:hypothetical protein
VVNYGNKPYILPHAHATLHRILNAALAVSVGLETGVNPALASPQTEWVANSRQAVTHPFPSPSQAQPPIPSGVAPGRTGGPCPRHSRPLAASTKRKAQQVRAARPVMSPAAPTFSSRLYTRNWGSSFGRQSSSPGTWSNVTCPPTTTHTNSGVRRAPTLESPHIAESLQLLVLG